MVFVYALFAVGLIATIDRAECAVTITTPSEGNGVATNTIDEGSTTGAVITVAASGGPITAYTLISPVTNFQFAAAASGDMTVKSTASLDYEMAKTQEIIFTATDGTDTATGTVTVSIGDINDNPPIFNPKTYSSTVADNAAADTIVVTVTATDADGSAANNVVTYSIISGDATVGKFSFDGAVMKVATGQTLSRATTPSYTLVVHAIDSATTTKLTGTATVAVCVGSCTECNSPCSSATAMTASAIALVFALILEDISN